MTEVTISKNERELLLLLKENNTLQFHTVKNKISREIFDTTAFTLNEKKYVDAHFNEQKQCVYITLDQKGKAYLQDNPKARNLFFTDNKKWIIQYIVIPISTVILGFLLIKFFK